MSGTSAVANLGTMGATGSTIGNITVSGIGTFTMTAGAAVSVGDVDTSGVTSGTSTITLSDSTTIGATMTGAAGVDDFDGTGGADVISTGAGNDTIVGNSGADTITGGLGADNITGGAGLDSIILTETTNSIDTVILGSVASSADTVTGFVTASDILDLSAALTAATLTIGTQVAYTTTKATNIAAVTTAADTDAPVYYIKNTSGGAGEMSLTEIETAITAGSAATGEAVILVDNGTNTLVYFDLAAETDAGSGAGLILVATLVGITGSTALATGDLISV